MSWSVNLGGEASSQQDEASVIDKVEHFLADLGEGVWHQMTTAFHGTGTTDVLRQNVTPTEGATVDPQTGEQTVESAPTPPATGTVTTPDPGDQGPSTEGAS